MFVGGKGDRVIRTAVEIADGWNTCWVMEPASYRDRLDVVERACDGDGPRPGDLLAVTGHLRAVWRETRPTWHGASNGCASGRRRASSTACPLDEWRVGRLVGTVEQVREQAAAWAELGVETLILGPGCVPFQMVALEDLDSLAEALS